MQKTYIVLGGCALAIVISLLTLARGCGADEEVASKADWICGDCGHAYVFTQKEMEAHYRDHYGEPLSCPECDGLDVHPAVRCPHCSEVSSKPARGNTCPQCGQPLEEAGSPE